MVNSGKFSLTNVASLAQFWLKLFVHLNLLVEYAGEVSAKDHNTA